MLGEPLAAPRASVRNDADCEAILDGVIARTLPKPLWTHAAHCVFAVALLDRLTLGEAEEAAPRLIRLYNDATGVANSASDGYHHTITLFFLRNIQLFLAEYGPAPLAERVAVVLASPLGDPRFPLSAYPRERLFSPAARLEWVGA